MKKTYMTIIVIISVILLVGITEYRASRGIIVEDITIEANGRSLSGLLSYPKGEINEGSLPGVAVFHGFTGSKEMVRALTDGITRAGFVVVAIDQQGHGLSSGKLGEDGENSLRNDGVEVINYLKQLEIVDANNIGVLGHSMGAGTAIATSTFLGDLKATVLLGNALNGIEDYNVNTTFPQNVLLGIGKYDELLTVEEAIPNFRQMIPDDEPEVNRLYGSFTAEDARELAVTATDHILEVLNPGLVERSIQWLILGMINPNLEKDSPELDINGWSLVLDQFLSLMAGISLVLLIPVSLSYIQGSGQERERKMVPLRHGLLGFIAFMIGLPFGIFISFTMIFLTWYVSGFLLYLYNSSKQHEHGIREELQDTFSIHQDVKYTLLILLGFILIVQALLLLIHWDFRYVIPFLGALSFRRVGLFFVLFIPGIVFFTQEIRSLGGNNNLSISQFFIETGARIWVFSIFLMIHYLPIILFQFPLLPGRVGFLAFFIVGFLPVMVIMSILTFTGRYYQFSPLARGILASGFINMILAITLSFNV